MIYSWVYLRKVNLSVRSEVLRMHWNPLKLEKTFRSIRVQCVLRLFSCPKSYFRLFGELYIDDLDTAEQDFNGTLYGKICQSNIIETNYGENDRCPNLEEKSANHFSYRIALFIAIFTTNVILVNILIGTISNTLSTIKGDQYYLYSLEVKVRLYKNVIIILETRN